MNQHPEELLKAILETAVDSIIVIDERGIVQSVNPATEILFGFSSSEVIGNNIKMLMPSPYREEHDGYLEHYHATGQRKIIGIGREVVGQRKDGSTFPMHLAVSEVIVGERKLFTGIVRDITGLKEAQKQLAKMNDVLEKRVRKRTEELRAAQADLVQAEKMATLGQVSGGIAHEIRNPLNAVKTSAYYLLNAKEPSQAKIREHLERIDRQVSMIDNVVTALSDVARLPTPLRSSCHVAELVNNSIKLVAMSPSIKIESSIPDDLPAVFADPNQIPIVFRNLIRNARDAMSDGGTIKLSATIENQHVTVHVQDTGCGIAPEDLDRITEPLYSTKARGMGLGLAISKAILEKNGGTLTVKSQVGMGTTFSVMLEVAAQRQI